MHLLHRNWTWYHRCERQNLVEDSKCPLELIACGFPVLWRKKENWLDLAGNGDWKIEELTDLKKQRELVAKMIKFMKNCHKFKKKRRTLVKKQR